MIEGITDISGISPVMQGTADVESGSYSFRAIFETTLESAEPENWDPENTGEFVTMGMVNTAIKQDFSQFQKLVDGVLQDAGISVYPEFAVRMDTENKLYIDGDRADKELIEELLNSDSEIRNTFNSLQDNVKSAVKMERFMDFVEVYTSNQLNIADTREQFYGTEDSAEEDFSVTVTADAGYEPNLVAGGHKFELSVFSDIAEAIAAGIDYTVETEYSQSLEFEYLL